MAIHINIIIQFYAYVLLNVYIYMATHVDLCIVYFQKNVFSLIQII